MFFDNNKVKKAIAFLNKNLYIVKFYKGKIFLNRRVSMSRNSKLISENLREEIAKELGVYDQVKKDGGSWENVSSKTCGNIVSKAIEIANRAVE